MLTGRYFLPPALLLNKEEQHAPVPHKAKICIRSLEVPALLMNYTGLNNATSADFFLLILLKTKKISEVMGFHL